MKKVLFRILLLISLLIPMQVKAASGTIKVSSASNVVVGNTITVSVTLSSSSALGAWEFGINYDDSYLELVSSNAEANGTYFVSQGNGSIKTKTYTLKFKAKKSGTTNITVGSFDIYAYDTSEMTITKTNKKIKIMTQQELEDSYSKDNNLKGMEVSVEGKIYELDKAFDKDTLDYSVTLPTGTNMVNVKAQVNDTTASVNGDGEIEVTEGANKIPIVVTAQNGDTKTYNLTINVEDQNPINVKVNKENYVVIKNASLLVAPPTFSETTVNIENFEIPAFINNIANITLVGLKDEMGDINLFIYDEGNYEEYQELNLKSLLIVPQKMDEDLDLIKSNIKVNGREVEGYKYSENSDFVIFKAKSLEDGQTELYLYDTKNNTAQKYDNTYALEVNKTIKNYSYVIMTFGGLIILLLIIILGLLRSLHKKQKKIKKFLQKQEAKLEATRKLNDVVKEVQKVTKNEKKGQDNKEKIEEKVKVEKIDKKDKIEKVDNKKEQVKEEEKLKIDNDDDSDEVYDLFADDRKLRKKKKNK